MKLLSVKWAGLALAGLLAASVNAQAASPYDYKPKPTLDAFCDLNPYDDVCGGDDYDDDEPAYQKKRYKKKSHYNNNCAAYIRAAGKRNLVRGFARNSALFAWRREVRAVHGSQYANWNNARNAEITCSREGALKACVAKATPCKY
jgi:hypothetical protein